MAHRSWFSGQSRPPGSSILLPAVLILATVNLGGSTEEAAGNPFIKRTFTYKIIGNCTLKADLYRSPDNVIRPLIIWIHGGALIIGYRENVSQDQMARYVRAGFAVISIDYRLAPETKLPQLLEDVQDAQRWARKKGLRLLRIDPDRIAVVGHSAGGYLALTTGYMFQPRPRAIVSFYGYGDIGGDWYSKPDPYYLQQPAVSKAEALEAVSERFPCDTQPPGRRSRFYLYCRQQGLWPKEVSGRDPRTDPKAFDVFCPIRNIAGDYPPTMLLHGDKDTDVPFEQSFQMYNELTRHSVECEFIRVPGGGHAFDKAGMKDPEVEADFDRVIAFLRKHLN